MTQPTKHTPGPWKVDGDTYITAHSLIIAHCKQNGSLKLEDAQANARLMAAAPDLLEAAERACIKLKELADDYPDDNYWNECIESLNAAIAKATKGQ